MPCLRRAQEIAKHLQSELEEMVNPMPVGHGSVMIELEEAGEWFQENSRETSQHYDGGLEQIITKLHGSGER